MPNPELSVQSSSVHNWSTVPPDTVITFRFTESVDARSAQSGIRVVAEAIRADVRLNENGIEAIWKPLSRLAEGHHTLRVEGVTSADGERFVMPWELNFTVAA